VKCECAHSSHFDPYIRTPGDCLGHDIGEDIPSKHIVKVEIDGRIAKVCKNCVGDCLVKGKVER